MRSCEKAASRLVVRMKQYEMPLVKYASNEQALEALILRCPAEITPFLGNVIQVGTQFIKYDPVCIICHNVQMTETYRSL